MVVEPPHIQRFYSILASKKHLRSGVAGLIYGLVEQPCKGVIEAEESIDNNLHKPEQLLLHESVNNDLLSPSRSSAQFERQ
eukprot:g8783.t1